MYEIKIPQMGQSVEEASIVKWFKREGERVQAGEPLFSIQTDKAEVECESTASGVLRKILLDPDIIVPVMTVIAFVGEPDEPLPDGVPTSPSAPPLPGKDAAESSAPATVASGVPFVGAPGAGGRLFVSPRARKQAESLGLDVAALKGSGPQGRIVEADVLARAGATSAKRVTPTARRMAQAAGIDIAAIEGTGFRGKVTKADVAATVSAPIPKVKPPEGVQRIPLTPIRRIIAKRMAESKFSAPHYYITIEVDMAASKAFRANAPYKPSFNDLVLRATVKALRDYPAVNARWAGDAIEQVADINLGVAVALPVGLIVPVLKQAQNMSLEDICAACKVLAEKARAGKLLPDDFSGNTFTVSNLGPYGVDHFTAIINQPDSAILAIGQMKDRVVVIEGGLHIRPIMKMTMSSDHRVIDGALAAQFMARLKEIMEAADFG